MSWRTYEEQKPLDYPKNHPSVLDNDIPEHIEALLEFLGRENVKRALDRYNKGKRTNSNKPIYDAYYFSQRNPWLEGFLQYKRARERRHTRNDLISNPALRNLAIDSVSVHTVLQNSAVPDNTIEEYRRNFLSEENLKPYLLEIKTALHYLQSGGDIEWIEGKGAGKRPEFIVSRPDFKFQAECKYITFDKGRNFRRRDFYQLADLIWHSVSRLRFTGKIHIESTRLPEDPADIKQFAKDVTDVAKLGKRNASLFDGAQVTIDLQSNTNIILNPETFTSIVDPPVGSILAIWAQKKEPFQNPIAISYRCSAPSTVLDSIQRLIRDARKQFSDESPGAVHIFFEGFRQGDLEAMNNMDGFLIFNNDLFESEASKNVVAVCYLTGPYDHPVFYGDNIRMQALVFTNPNCPTQPPAGFKFVGARSS